ncbi:5939_t:CDS:2 [Funneliformis geosporum]|uniref:5939_t:CDS:1 n=1 Tax=Funneliformis geosporum TaxID=1117311 RepID=A0A9W4SLC9_9GLOM|nr:5939_t:CDS:2 [Funneliformis geosporum]
MTNTKSTRSSTSNATTINKPDKSSKLLDLLRRVSTHKSTSKKSSISSKSNKDKMKMPLTKKGIKKFKDKLKYTQKIKRLEMKKQLIKELKKEQTDKKKLNYERNLRYFTFSAEKNKKI